MKDTIGEPVIRAERHADRTSVFAVQAAAFESESEARLVDAVRPAADPLISLVAEVEGRIVGHILFTPVRVEENPQGCVVLGLGPMAVVPGLQNLGIGSKLVREGLRRCRALGAGAVVVLGHPGYYPRFGFAPAAPHELRFRSEELDPYFMALELRPGALAPLRGLVHYLPAFDED